MNLSEKIRNNEGASAVEFAIILPLLLLLLFGIVEFAVLLYDRAVLTNASREGARFGIVSKAPRVTDAAISAVVDNYCADHLITFGPASAATTTVSRTGTLFGDDLSVQVSYHYDFLFVPSMIESLVGGFNLTAETVMKYE